jgi:DNA-binding MarR family transcriptional regulator
MSPNGSARCSDTITDPWDRFSVATERVLAVPLVIRDGPIRDSALVPTISPPSLSAQIVAMTAIAMYTTPVPEMSPTVGYLVWRLSMKWRTAVDDVVAPLGLTHAQYSVLASLRGMARSGLQPSQRELADHTGLDPIYISKLVRSMEGSGLIERRSDDHDGRAVRLTVTRHGGQVADRAIERVGRLLDHLTEPLGGTSSERVRGLTADLGLLIAVPAIESKKRSNANREAK